MIGIKGMELPKSCAICEFHRFVNLARFICLRTNKTLGDITKIDKDCPIVDLGKEDMSWEELVLKLGDKALNKSSELGCIEKFEIEPCGLSFYKNGAILDEHNDYILIKQTPYQMYQIIKSLVGDER
jgi:hypothetical protein